MALSWGANSALANMGLLFATEPLLLGFSRETKRKQQRFCEQQSDKNDKNASQLRTNLAHAHRGEDGVPGVSVTLNPMSR